VLAVFLGGLAVGALAVAERSRRMRSPLLAYALAEGGLALAGLVFHPVFVAVTGGAYDALLPAVSDAGFASVARWVLAVGLILPQSILLGTTFPLMSAGVVRLAPDRSGRRISSLYFLNSLGGAVGVLLGGFVLVTHVGLPGTLVAAALLNVLAAVGAVVARPSSPRVAGSPTPPEPTEDAIQGGVTLWTVLLVVSFGTAVASFIYEIGWIRMLSLVMGSATHSFEIMLSGFILGLAIGALVIRRRTDFSRRPVKLLGIVQWCMGLTALATLPVYLGSFGWMAELMDRLPRTDTGYGLFGVARYALALAIMLPSTICAGMTLPLITNTLLRRGAGERAIGWVYGVNTLGSVLGVGLAGLILLPSLGLERMIVAGAALDMALGVGLLILALERGAALRRLGLAAAGVTATGATVALALAVVDFEPVVLTGGVFRYGAVPDTTEHRVVYYADGRTATVGVHAVLASELVVQTSNGKPDASLSRRWLRSAEERLEPGPIEWQDESTQLLSAMTTLAHAPRARRAAMIGHGSGISAHYLLSSPALESLVTIEIEPRMIEASRAFYPANERAFDDPRSSFVIDDAKAYFAARRARYDLILSEPSNPWVSGVASLFTREFYDRVSNYLTADGVFGQWIQLYEIRDDDLLTILAALDDVFGDYRGFLVGDTDLLLVATGGDHLPEPDWSVFDAPALVEDLAHVLPFTPDHMNAIRLFDGEALAPLVSTWSPVNSDYRPILGHRAERGRFVQSFASGFYGLAIDPFDLVGALAGRRAPLARHGTPAPVLGLEPMITREAAGVFREAVQQTRIGGPGRRSRRVPAGLDERGRTALGRYGLVFEAPGPGSGGAVDWRAWTRRMERVERRLHGEASGAADASFFEAMKLVAEQASAPEEVHAAIDFLRGLRSWDWSAASRASDVLVEVTAGGERWLDPSVVHDGAVVARLAVGRIDAAERALLRLGGERRRPDDLRVRLLRAYVAAAR